VEPWLEDVQLQELGLEQELAVPLVEAPWQLV
jgi:hypothetical protein